MPPTKAEVSNAYRALETFILELELFNKARENMVRASVVSPDEQERFSELHGGVQRGLSRAQMGLEDAIKLYAPIAQAITKLELELPASQSQPGPPQQDIITPLRHYIDQLEWMWMRPEASNPQVPFVLEHLPGQIAAEREAWKSWFKKQDETTPEQDSPMHPENWDTRNPSEDMPKWPLEPEPASFEGVDLESARWMYWTIRAYCLLKKSKNEAFAQYKKKFSREDKKLRHRSTLNIWASDYAKWADLPAVVVPRQPK